MWKACRVRLRPPRISAACAPGGSMRRRAWMAGGEFIRHDRCTLLRELPYPCSRVNHSCRPFASSFWLTG